MNRIRNNNMYQRPESIDPGFVDIAPLQLFNPAIAEMGKDILSKAQERYDASQDVIAKYIEDYGSTPMREADKINVMNKLQSDLDRLHQEVKTKGVGYADSLPEIIKSLSKARGTLHLAKQDYEKEQALRKQYDAQVVSGKAPRTIGRDDDGRIVEKPMTFEEFSKGLGVSNSGFDETGQYKGYNTMSIRGRGEHDKWIMENVSNPIMQQIIQGDPEIMKGIFGDKMWKSITTKGMSDEGVDIYFNTINNQTGKTAGDEIVDTFLANSTFAPEEFGGDRELAKEYVKNLVKIQTVKSINKTFDNVPDEIEKPEEPYIPPVTFTGQGRVDEINQKAVKEAEKVKTTLGKVEAVRKKINIIKDNDLPVFKDIPIPEWENPITPDFFPELEAKWKAGEASYSDAARLGGKRMAQAASYVAGLVERAARWVSNDAEEGRQKIDLTKDVYSAFGQEHDGKHVISSLKTKDKVKMSKYLELLWDEKEKYNLIKDAEGLIKIDDTRPSGTRQGVDAKVNYRYVRAAEAVSKILKEGLDNMEKVFKESYNKIQEYREKNPIVDILAGRFAEESNNDPFTMYNKAIEQIINTKKDQELAFSKTTPLSKLDNKGDDIVKNNIKSRIIQMPSAGVKLEYNTDNGLQTIDPSTAEDINKAIVDNKLQSTQLDINNFNLLLTTDDGINYKVDIMPLLPDNAKPVVQSVKDFVKRGTELDFFKRDGQGNIVKENGNPIYEEPIINLPFGLIKYELSTKGETVKPILKGSKDNGNTWQEISSVILTTFISEYLNTVLSQTRF